jgi:hypothetical protein
MVVNIRDLHVSAFGSVDQVRHVTASVSRLFERTCPSHEIEVGQQILNGVT